MTEPLTLTGIGLFILSAIAREIYKEKKNNKKVNGNGIILKEVKETVKETDKKVDEMKNDITGIKKDVKNQEKRCSQVTKSFEKQIEDNRNRIFNLKK